MVPITPASSLNSAGGTESGGDGKNLPVCSTCHQKARSVDKFAKDATQILKWSKCDPDKDGDVQKLGGMFQE